MAGLKLLGGLVRLDALYPAGFSAAQLADHARVEPETARAFLKPEKGPGYAEVIPGVKADGRGRPHNLYRLRPNKQSELLYRLAEMRRELDGISMPSTEQLFAPLDLLEASLAVLEARSDPPEAWRDRVTEARLELAGATADLRSLNINLSPDAEPFARRLEKLQGRLTAVESAGAPHTFVDNSQVTGRERTVHVRQFLERWKGPNGVPELEEEVAAREFLEDSLASLLDKQLSAVRDEMSCVLLPGYGLLRLRRALTRERQEALSQIIRGRLSEATTKTRPTKIAALAAAAAAINAVEAAEPLLRALLIPGVLTSLGGLGRETCALALARLARPSNNSAQLTAAAACHFLLARPALDEMELVILAPAALRAPYANPAILLNDFAKILFDADGLKGFWRDRIEEAVVMRNLALVLHDGGFAILQQQISTLLTRNYGCALLMALGNQENGALKLRDIDGERGFAVSPGKLLAEQAGIMDTEVPLSVRKEVRGTLSQLLTSLSWNESKEYDEMSVGENPFTGQLARPNRPALQLLAGGRQ
jgi:hypothetical protein